MPGTQLEKTETALTENLVCARHWLEVFTDPGYKEEYDTIPALREVKVHMSVDTNLY